MSNNQKITKTLNIQAAETFVRSIQEQTPLYVFAAKHTPFGEGIDGGSDDLPPSPRDSTLAAAQVYDDMIFGKRVKEDSISNMIKRYEWKENTVYGMYSDSDPELFNKQFYVVVDDTIELNVYKCLYNNNDSPSIQRPSDKDTSPVESPQDGYIWKYMFTIDQFNLRKFATAEYVPATPSEIVSAAAVDGSIEIFTVQDGGAGYNNYTAGSFPDAASIAIGSNNRRFGLASNASNVKGFYNDCIIKMITGPAANEYRLITNFEVDSNGRKVIDIVRAFNNLPNQNDEYEIFPNVFVYNTRGNITSECVARAIINGNAGNSVSRIEVLNAGSGYRAAAATISANASGSAAVITPIMSPPGGHGSNINNELYGNYVGVTASFIGNSLPLTIDNDYRTIGLLREPQFSRVDIKLDPSNRRGTFFAGEEVYRYKPIKLFGTASVNIDSTTVIGSNTEFVETLRNNDRLIITDGINNTLANVQSIVSNTNIMLDVPSRITGENCAIYLVDAHRIGTVVSSNSVNITLTNVIPVGIENSSYLLGDQSYCTAAVEVSANTTVNILINGRDADEFNSFNQLSYFVGNGDAAASFIEDELLYQGSDPLTRATARMHSYHPDPELNKDRLFVTNILNVFDGNTITGETSGATFNPIDKYNGEIVPGSGEILYLENLFPITRDVRQTETVKLIIEF